MSVRAMSWEQKELSSELDTLENRGIQPGLQRIAKVARALGNPQDKFPAILITGTNGKGSVAATLETVLRFAGYKTGLYTSPHLIHYTERIRINNKEISPASLRELLQVVLSASREAHVPLTQFEVLTLVAFLALGQERVEMAIAEVGLGGRWDATNILGHVIATVITNIDLDHTEWLGNTRVHIAREKAGVIRPKIPLVTAAKNPGLAVIEDVARAQGSPLLRKGFEFEARGLEVSWIRGTQDILYSCHPEVASRTATEGSLCSTLKRRDSSPPAQNDTFGRFTLGLLGTHQVENASVALATTRVLEKAGYRVPRRTVEEALLKTRCPGRFEFMTARISGRHLPLLLDGAHNPAGSENLASTLAISPWGKKPLTVLFGCMKDKDILSMVRHLSPYAGYVLTVPVPSSRSASPQALARIWSRHGKAATPFSNAQKALAALAKRSSQGPILATGSLYLVGELKRLLAFCANGDQRP